MRLWIQVRRQSRKTPVPSDRYWPPPTSSLVTTYSLACHSGITGTSRATASCSERKSRPASLWSAYCWLDVISRSTVLLLYPVFMVPLVPLVPTSGPP
ncbi:hypothetical protein ADL12_14560 [Streptomyces regalis]|uniref:Uncharacterized protein n=1 Tax=Streptomyces regalis TaxID=68262 RepID=A0A0X3V4F7_9ACTN|nr:hypothetical protein ADL12_14560 [Streptomyces regalis]